MAYRNFGTHGGRPSLRGGSSTGTPASIGSYAPSNLPPFPQGSILNSSRSAFERFNVPQAFRDVGLVLLGSLTLGSLIAVFAILLFVRI